MLERPIIIMILAVLAALLFLVSADYCHAVSSLAEPGPSLSKTTPTPPEGFSAWARQLTSGRMNTPGTDQF